MRLEALLMFEHPTVGYRTYRIPGANGYVTHWPSPERGKPRVQRYRDCDGVGVIVETIHLEPGENPEPTIIHLLRHTMEDE